MSDDELIKRIKRGDEKAAEELVNRYYTSILRYCRWHCAGVETAEDLTQETFLRLFRGLPQYHEKKKFKSYLYTIANNLCIDEARKIHYQPLSGEEEIADGRNVIAQIDDREEIYSLLQKLSDDQREAVLLRFGEQLSYLEIARVMGCNMRTAQSRVRNALKNMRENR